MAVETSHADRSRAGELKWRGAPPGMSPAMANEFMEGLKTGSTIAKLTLGYKSAKYLVSYERFKKHCELDPEWAAEARRISRANGLIGKGVRLRNLTHCKYGHPLSGANIAREPNGRRKCLTCVKRREQAPIPPAKEQVQQMTAALNRGSSLTLVCTGRVGGLRVQAPIFGFRKLKLYRRMDPAFDRFVTTATAQSNSKGQQRRHNPTKIRVETSRAETNDFYKIVNSMPARLPPEIRDDIAQSIMLALLEGSLQRDQVPYRIRKFVTEHNRMFPTKYAKFGGSPLVSLDEALFNDGSTTRGDTISRGLWD
jgi:hypothetical protein